MLGDTYQVMLFTVIIVKGGEGEVVETMPRMKFGDFIYLCCPLWSDAKDGHKEQGLKYSSLLFSVSICS